ncbi:MAG: DUF4417 domain-containing protein [Bacilli bacterium]|nr:DUF4417 domain-containing protein [Bacilli bacterium]
MKSYDFAPVPDSFQAFLVKGAQFTRIEEYPILERSSIATVPPKRIIPFDKALRDKHLSESYVCFYSPDASFERIRKNPRRYVNIFAKRCAGIIGFDFSIHCDMPLVKQKAQMNDNLSLTFYYAKNGATIIPNIRFGIDSLADEFLSAIPKNCLVAVGCHGFIKTKVEKAEWFWFLDKIINTLEPTGIVVYGTLNGSLFDSFKSKVPFYCYQPWINADRKRRKNNDI